MARMSPVFSERKAECQFSLEMVLALPRPVPACLARDGRPLGRPVDHAEVFDKLRGSVSVLNLHTV